MHAKNSLKDSSLETRNKSNKKSLGEEQRPGKKFVERETPTFGTCGIGREKKENRI